MPIAHLNEGGACFLVQIEKNDEDIKKGIDENHFKQYLEQEKFKNPGFGFWGCPWYFINIDSMVYVPGRPGIAYATPPSVDMQLLKMNLKQYGRFLKAKGRKKMLSKVFM